MLVLTRRVNERIMIGDDIEIVVIRLRDGKVRLGISCPREIPVHRREIWEEIRDAGENPSSNQERED